MLRRLAAGVSGGLRSQAALAPVFVRLELLKPGPEGEARRPGAAASCSYSAGPSATASTAATAILGYWASTWAAGAGSREADGRTYCHRRTLHLSCQHTHRRHPVTSHTLCRQHATAAQPLPPPPRPPSRQGMHATVDIAAIINRQKGPKGFQVIEFFPNAIAKEWFTPLDPETLGIHPRDLSLFHNGGQLAPQRATITARDNVIFLRTEAVRAIISPDKVLVFKSDNERDNKNIIAPMLQAIGTHQQFLPFELCAVEVLLHASLNYFERRVSHLLWMLDATLHELQGTSLQDPLSTVRNETVYQQLLPLNKALTAVRNDATETCAAIAAILSNDKAVDALCLSEQRKAAAAKATPEERAAAAAAVQPVPHQARTQATRMLQSYERELSSVQATLIEMEENLDTARETWTMRLDSSRNQFMVLNIMLSMVSISLTVTMVMPTVLGANIQNGFEDMQWLFYGMAGFSVAVGLMSYPVMVAVYKRRWKTRAAELNTINGLRIVLMQHLGDLDDILAAFQHMPQKVNRKQFGEFIRRRLPNLDINRDTLDFLFQQLDRNHDGFFEALEALRISTKELEAMGKASMTGQIHHHLLRSTALADLVSEKQQSQASMDVVARATTGGRV